MGLAGAETALISLLGTLDYSRVSVDLLSIINRGEMFARVPPRVRVINKNHSPKPVLGTGGAVYIARTAIAGLFRRGYIFKYIPYAVKNTAAQLKAGKFRPDKLLWLLLARTAPVPECQYDLAIAFIEGASTYYVAERVRAAAKITFNHVNYIKAGYIADLDRGFYEVMDYICCVSEPVRRVLDETFPEFAHKTRIFPNIIRRENILAAASLPGGFEDGIKNCDKNSGRDCIKILTVARLHPQKGLDIAVRAFAKIARPGIKWYVIGDGTQRNALKRLIKQHGLRDSFILLGSRANPYPYIAQADIYAQPSRFEGLGISLMEAMMLGKPCVTSNFDGLPGTLRGGEEAIIIDLTEQNLADALDRLITDPALRARLAESAGKHEFEVTDKTGQLYKIINGNKWEQ